MSFLCTHSLRGLWHGVRIYSYKYGPYIHYCGMIDEGEYPLYEARLIKMTLKLSTHEACSCISTEDFGDLSSKKRQGVYITCTLTETSKSISIRICVVNPKEVNSPII